jgi:DNA-binding MltR family transcriptional regulator
MNEEQFVSEMFDVVMDFRHSLRNETDRGCALMAGEFLSNELAALLRRRFVHDAKACDAVLEDANGSLASFSSRIEFAYLLGLIGPNARRELHLVRRIRNDFAHDYKPLDFNAEGVANDAPASARHHANRQTFDQVHDLVGAFINLADGERRGAIRRHHHAVIDLHGDNDAHRESLSHASLFGGPAAGENASGPWTDQERETP